MKKNLIGVGLLLLLMISGCFGKSSAIDRYPVQIQTLDGIKWGYIDRSGKWKILATFTNANDFQSNGFAVVAIGERYGVIKQNGEFLIKPKYDEIGDFHEGFAIAVLGEEYFVINQKGKVIYKNTGNISDFHNGLASVTRNERTGYIDQNGKEVIPVQYTTAGDYTDGKALVRLEKGKYGIINKAGKLIHIIKRYNLDVIMGNGLIAFQEKPGGKWGYIDQLDRIVIQPKFRDASVFENGLAVIDVSNDGFNFKYGIINQQGQFIIEPKYSDIQSLGEGLFALGNSIQADAPYMGNRYALANAAGKILSSFQYGWISKFSNGIAAVLDQTQLYFIDPEAKKVTDLPSIKGYGELALSGELVKGQVDYRLIYMDKRGHYIWKEGFRVNLGNGIQITEGKYHPHLRHLVYYPQINGLKNRTIQNNINQKFKKTFCVDGSLETEHTFYGNFSIALFQKNLLVFKYTAYDFPLGAAHGMPIQNYIHLDLKTGRFYELKNLFKNDSLYLETLNEVVRKQIFKYNQNHQDYPYWIDQYQGIQIKNFILTKTSLKLYFYPYDIAPYAAGFPEFEIPYSDIQGIMNMDGELWKSFH